jgi:hypothetical protein
MQKLIALPTVETRELLQELMSASPIPIDYDSMFIEIGVSDGPIPTNPSAVYTATTLGGNVWYETATGSSYLIFPLQAEQALLDRHNAVGDSFGRRHYVPYLVGCREPVMRRQRKSWINSIASTLALNPRVLSFHNELVVEETGVVPTQADFYQNFVSTSFL